MGLVASSLGTSEHAAIDVARMGGIIARGYDCRWRTIDASITPENRMLIGLARHKAGALANRKASEKEADERMGRIYAKIHHMATDPYSGQEANEAGPQVPITAPVSVTAMCQPCE